MLRLKDLSEELLRLPFPAREEIAEPHALRCISRILVFGKFPNPTFDYYFAARMIAPGMPDFYLVDVRDFKASAVEAEGSFALVIRYSSFSVSRWLVRHRSKLAGIAVFVDDDIAAAITSPEASFRYRYRLFWDCILPLRMLDNIVERLWASTEKLAARLPDANALIVPPAPGNEVFQGPARPGAPQPDDTVSIAYHATAIHRAEHEFLLPVVAKVLEARPLTRFEVIATGKSANLWLGLHSDRVSVKPPRPWNAYLQGQIETIDIMLVPVAPTKLNDSRADTKRIDVVRVGAAAILSDCPAFRPAEEGEILLPYDQAQWIQKIIELVDLSDVRATVAEASFRRVLRMSRRGKDGIPSLAERSVDQCE